MTTQHGDATARRGPFHRTLRLLRGAMLMLPALFIATLALAGPAQAGGPENLDGLGYGDDVQAFQADQCLGTDGELTEQTARVLSSKVREIQQLVGTGVDGEYGPNTTDVLKAWQSENGVEATGKADEQTMKAMEVERARDCDAGPVDSDVRRKIVEIAQGEVGTTETGGNCNPYGNCEAWCAWFSSWVWEQAGVEVHRHGFTGAVFDWGAARGTSHWGTTGISPGDMVFYGTDPGSPDSSTHVDVVTAVDGDTLTLVGGNVKDAVTERQMTISEAGIYGFTTPE